MTLQSFFQIPLAVHSFKNPSLNKVDLYFTGQAEHNGNRCCCSDWYLCSQHCCDPRLVHCCCYCSNCRLENPSRSLAPWNLYYPERDPTTGSCDNGTPFGYFLFFPVPKNQTDLRPGERTKVCCNDHNRYNS